MKFNGKSIGVKLWLYFILFAAVILTLLWLLQTVFLQSFYERMKTNDIAQIADTIINEYGRDDIENTIDALTFRNSVLVFITDAQGNVIYTSDEHGSGGGSKFDDGPKFGGGQDRFIRSLPIDYEDFLTKLSQSGDGAVSYTQDGDKRQGRSLIYGAKLPDGVLYISTPLDPVNATTNILRTQLVYVTIVALLLSFIIAFFISRRFSQPVTKLSDQAAELAKGNNDVTFSKGFCSEIDDLASTLDQVAIDLSKVEKLRRELIANISHDLRTPLTMIKAYTEMILDISGERKEKREEHLAVIAAETDRLTVLVNDILEFSTIQSGAVEPCLDNISLSDVVKKVASCFKPIAEHEGYKIITVIEPDQYVLADGQKFEQVLYNLIGNAVNYIGEDKTITINLIDLGGRVRFEVKDNGEGIPEEELAYIWDRYYKAKTHRRPVAGTGLGLSIVKGVLELHGARYGVDSRIGAGSLFWFELKK